MPRERVNAYCKECARVNSRFTNIINISSLVKTEHNDKMLGQLHEFVERLTNRKEMASFEEIFVELITLHNHFCKDRDYKNQTADMQIPKMWRDLKSISEKIKNKK